MNDINTILKYKNNETIAWLYDLYGKRLYGFAVAKWKLSEDDAWNMVYKTLYKVLKVGDRYTFINEDKFGAFLFKVFVNNLRNHYRDTKAKGVVEVELLEKHEKWAHDRKEGDDAGSSANEKQSPLMACLQKVLAVLEDWQRVLLLMRAQEHAYEDISKYVSRPGEQLKVYHHRLKKVVTEKTNDCLQQKTK
ncbi:MAG: hypothetical protein V4635_09620 [Bacteroidota bacterium]